MGIVFIGIILPKLDTTKAFLYSYNSQGVDKCLGGNQPVRFKNLTGFKERCYGRYLSSFEGIKYKIGVTIKIPMLIHGTKNEMPIAIA